MSTASEVESDLQLFTDIIESADARCEASGMRFSRLMRTVYRDKPPCDQSAEWLVTKVCGHRLIACSDHVDRWVILGMLRCKECFAYGPITAVPV